MRFKAGIVVGFAVGYYFGAKAGRQRYLQLRGWLHGTAADKAKAVVDLGVERARDLVDRAAADEPTVINLAAGGGYSPSR
jgi:hypothetical protein